MGKNSLITQQALKIVNLEAKITAMTNAADSVERRIVCIAGPLNGNKLQYSTAQMRIFQQILDDLHNA